MRWVLRVRIATECAYYEIFEQGLIGHTGVRLQYEQGVKLLAESLESYS